MTLTSKSTSSLQDCMARCFVLSDVRVAFQRDVRIDIIHAISVTVYYRKTNENLLYENILPTWTK